VKLGIDLRRADRFQPCRRSPQGTAVPRL